MRDPESITGDESVSVSTLARLVNCDRKTAADAVKPLTPVKNAANERLYRLDEALAALYADDALARKRAAEARLKELDVQEREGDLLKTADVRRTFFEYVKELDAALCVAYPREAARRLAEAEGPEHVADILGADLPAILDEVQKKYTIISGGSRRRAAKA
jgi:hypothetical protein